MKLRSIRGVKDLAGKRVLVRVDYNVPIVKGKVGESYRIHASLDTIRFLLEKKARVVLLTHIGRPRGVEVKKMRVDPLARELRSLLGIKVPIIRTRDWSNTEKISRSILKLRPGAIAMCDNIRFAQGEEKNKEYFAKELASLGDIFVIDGFGVSHRASPSVSGIASFIPTYAGILLEKEVAVLSRVQYNTKKQHSVLVIGGAKTETKLPVITHLHARVGHVLVGGSLVNTYLGARGFEIGTSLVDMDMFSEISHIKKIKNIVWPLDVVVGNKDGSGARVVSITKKPSKICESDEAILDIGPETIRMYAWYIQSARMIIWNGAMGYFEQKPYHMGTYAIARVVGSRARGKAFGIVGGGETIQALEATHQKENIDFVSTGGGAMLEFFSGKILPGIEIVTKK